MKRKWYRVLLHRRLSIALLILIQIAFLIVVISFGIRVHQIVSHILNLISLGVLLHIIVKQNKGANKLVWAVTILIFPLFGGLLYLLFKFQSSTATLRRQNQNIRKAVDSFRVTDIGAYERAMSELPHYHNHIKYLQECAKYPIFEAAETEYLSPGEVKFERLREELLAAERFIFLEYFIISEGKMWGEILEILKEKAAAGVEVRVIYDDMGCFLSLPKNYKAELESFGIKCTVFNPFRPIFSVLQNNRDHRKILVIDGKVAFTGGINLADEYINAIVRFGHWKDASVMVRGRAVASFTLMFLEMWSSANQTTEDYTKYMRECEPLPKLAGGFVQPYADTPMDGEDVSEQIYLHIINSARKYLYICTPYFIVDDSMVLALTRAAKSGVDVRIMTPHIPDKKLIYITTKSYYGELIAGGVKIYEYTKGFVHSKTFVADDEVASVGTANLDFRSLYMHFECGAMFYKTDSVLSVRDDFVKTLEVCREVTAEDCKANIFVRIFRSILRLFAPIM